MNIRDLEFCGYQIDDTFKFDGDKWVVVAFGVDSLYAYCDDYAVPDEPVRFSKSELPINRADAAALGKLTKAQLIERIMEDENDE